MKKITLLICAVIMMSYTWQSSAQTLNQNASWPNGAWSLSGTYSANAGALEGNPTVDANFAFDDDDAGSGSDDNIEATSPVINLTAASTAGETWITVTADYVHRYLANDDLRFQYWDADTSTWMNWGPPLTTNTAGAPNDLYCAGTPISYTTAILNISTFTATQLSGFMYRIAYDDDPAGADYNYGFCFSSPTITSATPPSCADPTALAASATDIQAVLSWTENGGATLWNIELVDITAAGTVSGTPTSTGVTNPFTQMGLVASNDYTYYVQADCAGAGLSNWVGPFAFTTNSGPAPGNDECNNSIPLAINADYDCGIVTAGTNENATASPQADDVSGTPSTDVWYHFDATETAHRVSLQNVTAVVGTSTDMGMGVYDATGGCSGLVFVATSDPNTLNLTGLTIGTTYLVRVYGWSGTTPAQTTFDVCVGTPPPPPVNDDCAGAISVTVGSGICGPDVTGTNNSATDSGVAQATCATATYAGGDIWYTFDTPAGVTSIDFTRSASVYSTTQVELFSGTCGALTEVACTTAASNTFAGLTGSTTYYLRIYDWGNDNFGDVTFCLGTPPTCEVPTALAATSTTTTADISWTAPTVGTPVGYNWEIQPDGIAQGTAGAITGNVVTTMDTATGLADSTAYDLFVQTDCGGGDLSSWAGPFSFTTACAAVSTFPSTTDFSTNPSACWSEAGSGEVVDGPTGTTSDWRANRAYTDATAAVINSNAMNLFTGNTDREWLISPVYDIPVGVPHSLVLNIAVTNWTSTGTSSATATDTMGSDDEVQLLQSVDGGTTWTNITTWNVGNQPAVTGTEYIADLTAVSGTIQFALWASDGTVDDTEDYDFHVGAFTVIDNVSLSVDEVSFDGFKYFPNPVSETLSLRAQNNIENVAIYNIVGQEVIKLSPNAMSKDVDMSSLSQGTYFVRVSINGATESFKIIKD